MTSQANDFYADGSGWRYYIAFRNEESGPGGLPYYWFGVVGYGQFGGVVGCAGKPTTRFLGPYSTFAGVSGTAIDFTGVAGTSVNQVGVYGQVEDNLEVPDGIHAGVLGTALTQPGVFGYSQGAEGVMGFSLNHAGGFFSSGQGYAGVVGQAYGPSAVAPRGGSGVIGFCGAAGPTPSGPTGVLGTSAQNVGVMGLSAQNVGVVGQSTQYVGVMGLSDALFGVYGRSNKSFAGFFEGDLFVRGAISAGTKDAIVPFPDGSKRLLHCMESPEHWFEDFGAAKLRRGRAMVKLDVDFAKVIKRGDYKVFLTPEGDCRGLYVRKSAASFEVREFAGGKSSVAFSYRIVGRRKDIRDHRRFAKFDVPVPTPAPRARRPSLTRAAFIADLERQARARATPSMRRSDREAAATPPAPARLIPGGRPPARRR
jgi:hypothetical protein